MSTTLDNEAIATVENRHDLDVVLGERAALGLSAAWYEREHAAYGAPIPAVTKRFERLQETLRVVHPHHR